MMDPLLTLSRPPPLFEGVLDKAQCVIHLLCSIMVEDKPTCLIRINRYGVKFTVEQNKVMQSSAFFSKDLFKNYTLSNKELIELRIDLGQFLSCLGVQSISSGWMEKYKDAEELELPLFSPTGANICLGLKVNSDETALMIEFEEMGSMTDCQINSLSEEYGFTAFPALNSSTETSKMVLRSDVLSEVWEDLDSGSEKITFTVSKYHPFFKISTKSVLGEVDIFLNPGDEGVEKYSSNAESPEEFSFRMSLMRNSQSCVHLAKKSVIRTSSHGFISVQHELEITPNRSAYIEYFCQAISDDDDFDITIPDM